VTLWLAGQRGLAGNRADAADTAGSGPPIADFAPCEPEVGQYRAAVGDLVAEFAQFDDSDALNAEHMLEKRLDEHDFTPMLEATPDGRDATIAKLLFDVRNYDPSARNSPRSLAALVRISMLVQIEAVWWGRDECYETDADLFEATELTDLDELSVIGQLNFSYRHQASTLLSRATRSAERRTLPGRAPRTAGLWLAKARPQAVAWLNQLADEFAEIAPAGTPPLWVNSLTRSVAHQRRLRELGYAAPLPSSHCLGYAADIEMAWYRRFRAHRLLRGLLLDRQRADEVNVIDEGQAWHVCLRPSIVSGPRSLRPVNG
jgi:hypothetical protein